MTSCVRLLLSAFAALSIGGAAATSAQAGSWIPPVPLAQGENAHPAGLALAPDGTVTTVTHTPLYVTGNHHRVDVRTKPPGGTFGPPLTLTAKSESAIQTVNDEQGNVAIVWTEKVAGTRVLRAATRPAGGSFGPAQTITDSGSDSDDWDVDMAEGGKLLLVWEQNLRIRAATATVGTPFSVLDPLTGQVSSHRTPKVAIAPSGAAVIVWSSSGYNADPATLHAFARPPGGAFAPIDDIAQMPEPPETTRVSMSAQGRATAAWSYSTGYDESDHHELQSASRGTNGDFGPVDAVGQGSHYSKGAFSLELSPDGTALMAWPDRGPYASKLRYAIRPEGSGFGAGKTVSGGFGRSSAPAIAFGDDKTAHAVWTSEYLGMASVQRARIPMDGSLATAETVGTPSTQPGIIEIFMDPYGLDADAQGNVALSWTRGTDTDPGPQISYKLAHEIRIFDNTPPTLTGVQVPATALSHVPVPMSAVATDSLTPVTLRWKLSKYVTLTGPAIAPVFDTPGARGVTLEAADAAGHLVTASRTFGITLNPAPPPFCPEGQICE